MPSITVNVDDLEERMEKRPESNRSELTSTHGFSRGPSFETP